MFDIVVSMYNCLLVKYNNYLCEPFSCHSGIRQGECLTPVLFAVYVNNI